jgi:hypothetical protein
MSTLYPIASYYAINPDNAQPQGLYFSEEIAQKFHTFTIYQTIFVVASLTVALFFFKNPPDQESDLSVYLRNRRVSKENILIVSTDEQVSIGNIRILSVIVKVL